MYLFDTNHILKKNDDLYMEAEFLYCRYSPAADILAAFSGRALAASRDNLKLWLNTLLPTLLPFINHTGILIHGTSEKLLKPLAPVLNHVKHLPSEFAHFLDFCAAIPMGTKITSDLYVQQDQQPKEAEYLLTFTNHASPVFIYTYLIHICLNDRFHPSLS